MAPALRILRREQRDRGERDPLAGPSNARSELNLCATARRDCAPTLSLSSLSLPRALAPGRQPLAPDTRIPLASRRTHYAGHVPACMIIVFLSSCSCSGYLRSVCLYLVRPSTPPPLHQGRRTRGGFLDALSFFVEMLLDAASVAR